MRNKTAASRLGFALLLKYFELEGRFPESREELPQAAVDYVAGLVGVDPSALAKYAWSGRTIEYHRAQIRAAHGLRGPTREDEDKLALPCTTLARMATECCFPAPSKRHIEGEWIDISLTVSTAGLLR